MSSSEPNQGLNRIAMTIAPRERDLGGFSVRRALPSAKKRMVGPFIFLDHMGPADLSLSGGMAVRSHPHIGLSTLTFLYEGRILHRDSLGSELVIEPGAVNWMTSGRGIAHSERTPESEKGKKTRVHGLQTWIALPTESEEIDPSFDHHPASTLPEISMGGVKTRVIAGRFEGQSSPVHSYSPILYLDCEMKKGQILRFHEAALELAAYIAIGSVQIGADRFESGQLAIFERGSEIEIRAVEDARIAIVGGEPFKEERHIWWNFVSSRKERIHQAADLWSERGFARVPNETEWIPLPESRAGL